MESPGSDELELDLNLLRVVLAIYDAGSVVAAAKKLGMSQPGLSTALQRARTALRDPLFVRVSKGIKPTTRTRKMVEPIRSVLLNIDKDVLNAGGFEPETYAGDLSLVLTDVGEATLLPRVVNHLVKRLPEVRIRSLVSTLSGLREAMADGSVDFALGFFPDLHDSQHRRAVVRTASFTCIVSAGHPIRGSAISLAEFLHYGHVDVDLHTHSKLLLDDHLDSHGIHRKVRLRTAHFMSIPPIVAGTDLIATVPAGVVSGLGFEGMLRIVRPEFAMPSYESSLYWHASMHHDLRNQWLRQVLVAGLAQEAGCADPTTRPD